MPKGDRFKSVTEEDFKKMLKEGRIRGASLNDVEGTHHKRPLYKHPRTGQPYVEVPKPMSSDATKRSKAGMSGFKGPSVMRPKLPSEKY